MNWQIFLKISAEHLNLNPCRINSKKTWCAWTTSERLGSDAGYWTAPIPLKSELLLENTSDGGTWGQPFHCCQLAHLIIPRRFSWETISDKKFDWGVHEQNIEGLSERLTVEGVPHRLSEYVLEVKLY